MCAGVVRARRLSASALYARSIRVEVSLTILRPATAELLTVHVVEPSTAWPAGIIAFIRPCTFASAALYATASARGWLNV